MKNIVVISIILLLSGLSVFAQVGINTDNSTPDPSAMLDVKSTSRGFLPPRMTAVEMNAIVTPSQGLLVYNTTVNSLFWFNGVTWKQFNEPYTEADPVFSVHPASGITSGNITNWNTAYTNRINAATGLVPLNLSISGNQLSGSINTATSSTNGYLTSTDWNSFNNKTSSQWTSNGLKLHYNSGNIGLGTTDPQNKIDIAGSAVIGSTYSGGATAPANGLLVEGKVGVGTTTPVASAALEVTSTSSGVLLPRMTRVQRNTIASPAEGLMVYCTTCGTNGSLSIFTNGSWMTFSPCAIAAPAAGSPVMSQGQIVWNWLAVAGAAGYKWNTTADYETATDMAAATTKTETGTTCGITYNRYI